MKKVEIGGQKRPIRFSYLALKDICNDCNLKLNQMDQLGTEIDHVGIIAYYGLKYGAKKNGEEFKYKVRDIEQWIDNEDFGKINEIFEAFQLDQPQKKGKVEEGEEIIDEDTGEVNWDKLEEVGLGMLGLSDSELYDLTPRSLDNKIRGFRKYNEQLSQNRWEQTRMIVHSCIVPHSKHRLKPKELMPFPWDSKVKIKKDVASKEQIAEVLKRYKLTEPKKSKFKMGGVKTISIIVAANIKGLEAGLGKANKSIAGFASNAARVGSMLTFGVTAPLTALGKQAFDTFSNFENAMMKVNAVTGATTEEFKMLTKEAKRLGSTTQFTASQVADLQLILGRKGFNPDAIQGMTESILDLALATGEDLSLASEVVSASINAFNLEAEDAARISNTLASAASDSSIQLNTFATAFGHAGASANAVGVNIEELSAMMGVLMDNGIKASKAGTGLRKIFMKLNETGTKFSDVLEGAAEKEMTLNDAQELVGTTAANQLLVLLDNIDAVNELSDSYETNTDKLKEMADLMGQTTFAKVKKLESAFEGFRLELGEVLAEMLMPMIETVTELFGEFGKLDRDTQKLIVTIGGIALAAGPVLIALGAMVALIPLLATGFGVVAGAVATVGTALSALGLEVIAGSAIFASIASFADTLGDEARLKEQEAARKKAIMSQKGFMLSTWATHQALEAETAELKANNKELKRQHAFKQEKAVDSAKAVPTLGAIAPTAISNVVQGTLINTTDAMQQMVDNFDAKTQAVKDTLTGFALDVGFAFSDAFAQMAVSGELSLQNLGNLFADLLKAMAKMVIQALIMTAIFSALGVAPAGGAFAGQGMSGFKQTMLGMMGGSFASGGQPPLGKVSLVGEQGPELFVPSQKGTIIPNHALGGGATPDVRISGDDLLIVFDRANRRKSRR